MTKDDLLKAIAKESGSSEKDAEKVLNVFIANVETAMRSKEKVTLVGFGTFEIPKTPRRQGINPRTGENIKIPATKVPVFRAGEKLREGLGPGGTSELRGKDDDGGNSK